MEKPRQELQGYGVLRCITLQIAHQLRLKIFGYINDLHVFQGGLLNLATMFAVRNPRMRVGMERFQAQIAKVTMSMVLSSREMYESQMKQARAGGHVAQENGFVIRHAERQVYAADDGFLVNSADGGVMRGSEVEWTPTSGHSDS